MKYLRGSMLLVSVLMIAGCGADGGNGEAGASAAAGGAGERMFPEDIGDDKCALLTLDDVVEATGVPASAIEQREISGCLYTWEDGDGWQEGTLWLSSVREAESIDRAKSRHARFTKDASPEDIRKAKEQMRKRLEEKRAEGEMSETGSSTASALTNMMPEDAVTHQRFDDIGNEAALNNSGTMYVRLGNVNFKFSGKTGGEDQLDPQVAREAAKRIIANLERAAGE